MTREEVMEMAYESGVIGGYEGEPELLERFAALVAAAEREKLKQSIRHSLTIGPKTIQTRIYFGEEEVSMVKMPIEEVVAAEREACAKVCEELERTLTDEKIAELWHQNGGFHHHFARAVERYLKGEK